MPRDTRNGEINHEIHETHEKCPDQEHIARITKD
jgi:hypothetical protein